MRTLPRNIVRRGGSLLVRVERGGMYYSATVPGTDAEALRIAVEKRDHFLRVSGMAARSNTGIEGVSESVMWRRHREVPCLIVHAGEKCRRIRFGSKRTRAEAMGMAAALRRGAGFPVVQEGNHE
jgi:hypothetical protein